MTYFAFLRVDYNKLDKENISFDMSSWKDRNNCRKWGYNSALLTLKNSIYKWKA